MYFGGKIRKPRPAYNRDGQSGVNLVIPCQNVRRYIGESKSHPFEKQWCD